MCYWVWYVLVDFIGIEVEFFCYCLVFGLLFGVFVYDDLFGNVDYGGIWWDFFGYYGVGVDFGVFVDGEWVEYFGIGIDYYVVVEGGVVFVFVLGGVVQGNVLIEGDVVVDFGGFVDDDVYVVVDEEVLVDFGFWVDFDVGYLVVEIGYQVCQLFLVGCL